MLDINKEFNRLLSISMPEHSIARQVLQDTYCPSVDKGFFTYPVTDKSIIVRTGPSMWDDMQERKQETVNVPSISYTVELEYDYTKSNILEGLFVKLADFEKDIVFPLMDYSLDVSGQLFNCPKDIDPYFVMATDAISMMVKDTPFNYKNVIKLNNNLYTLFASPFQVGVFCVFEDWHTVSIGSSSIVFQGKFGCAVQPKAIVGIIHRK